ncbi:hypothetical protein D3C78_1484000 [compost metagenome]
MKSDRLPFQLPPMAWDGVRSLARQSRNTPPLNNRSAVKDSGSMSPCISARRQKIEFAAKASRLKIAGRSQPARPAPATACVVSSLIHALRL